MTERRRPGIVRDAIIDHFKSTKKAASVDELHAACAAKIGDEVPRSSVRSYLNLNTPGLFERVGRGQYRYTGK